MKNEGISFNEAWTIGNIFDYLGLSPAQLLIILPQHSNDSFVGSVMKSVIAKGERDAAIKR